MEYEVFEKKVLSSDGIHQLAGKVYLPKGEPVGYFHVVHGMTEHIGRYDTLLREMASAGYLAFGYDNLGHGYTVNDETEFGFIASKDGWKLLCQDVGVFANAIRSEYPFEIPYILLGHSMGSFIVRVAAALFKKPDKLIVLGTAGPNPAIGAGLTICNVQKKLQGEKTYSPLLEKIAFGAYNKRFTEEKDIRSWLTKDLEIRRAVSLDPFCTFHFTVSAYKDLFILHSTANSKKCFDQTDREMPILLMSGQYDPVGSDGKGVAKVYKELKDRGANVEMIIYENCRHEILNDDSHPRVVEAIREFCAKQ